MTSTTAAGTTLAISAAAPSTETAIGYGALTFVEIGLVEKIGSFGASFNKVEFTPLKGGKKKFKGSVDYGTLQPSLAHDGEDAGQNLLRVASSSNALYSICITYPDGAKRYSRGRVFGYPENVDGADSIVMATPTIELSTPIVRVAAVTGPQPSLTISSNISVSEGNSGAQTVTTTVTVNRDGATGALVVNLAYSGTATSGTDYANPPASVTIASGQNSASFDISISGDTIVEPDETIMVAASLAAYPSATATRVITIGNDDAAAPQPTLTISSALSVAEGNSGTTAVSTTVTINRDGVTGALVVNLSYAGTATAGADYATPPATVTIPSGQNSASFEIAINGDTTVEPDETIIITAALAGYPTVSASRTITITNDDSSGGSTLNDLTLSPFVAVEGVAMYHEISGAQSGEVITLASPVSGWSVDNANRLLISDGTPIAGSAYPTLRGTLAGATNTPHDTPIPRIVASPGVIPSFATYSVFGDSYALGQQATTQEARWVNRFGATANAGAAATLTQNAVGGTPLQNTPLASSGNPATNNIRDKVPSLIFGTLGSAKRDMLVIAGGFNDPRLQDANLTPALYANDLDEVMNLARTGYYGTPYDNSHILAMGPYQITDGTLGAIPRATFEAYPRKAQLIAGLNHGVLYQGHYYSVSPAVWISGIGADNVHPSDNGYADIGAKSRRASIINPRPMPTVVATNSANGTVSYTVTQPSSGSPTGLEVQYGEELSGAWGNGTKTTLTGSWSGLPNAEYRVRARSTFGDGAYSPWAFTSKPIKVITVPTGAVFVDRFKEQDGVLLASHVSDSGGNWVAVSVPATGPAINNGEFGAQQTGSNIFFADQATANGNYDVRFTYRMRSTSNAIALAFGQAGAYYFIRYSGTAWEIIRTSGGSTTGVLASFTQAVAVGALGEIVVEKREAASSQTIQGTAGDYNVVIYHNGVAIFGLNESIVTGPGKPGIRATAAGASVSLGIQSVVSVNK